MAVQDAAPDAETAAAPGEVMAEKAVDVAEAADDELRLAKLVEGLQREAWQTAPAHFFDFPEGEGQGLTILGKPVMESWETPYMEALAAAACEHGGRVLEVGFGLGISAGFIDGHEGVTEHVILEANDEVFGKAQCWAARAARRTTVLQGFWQDLVCQLPDASFDAILFDVFPLDSEEAAGDGEVGPFFPHAARLLRPGGIFTFYFDAGASWIECQKEFRELTLPKLLAAGFSCVSDDLVECQPRKMCTYAWKNRFLVPLAVR
eukprot:TRINITY_DN24769_c1_g1_i1.p1 TRINITY_DN24769_c1_g1~~TRINITY_DN24769_c1_g1_i1.p1  ORF type:complete len:263 (+),score=71.30 TRINITY_DN24769_c1_g1_i1:65-853(+)